jgi:DNA-binding XRE family transcriptional regulator
VAKKLSKKSVKEIRARLQEKKPTSAQLVAPGDMEPPVSQATFIAAWQAVDALKKARLEAGLSLSQLAARARLDKATLSRLEAGLHLNPTLDTLGRYALALGRGLALSFPLLETAGEAGNGQRSVRGVGKGIM